jgi:hypothetical protein
MEKGPSWGQKEQHTLSSRGMKRPFDNISAVQTGRRRPAFLAGIRQMTAEITLPCWGTKTLFPETGPDPQMIPQLRP